MNKLHLGKLALIQILLGTCLLGYCGRVEPPTITLVENPWSASALNVAVAAILLEEQLGYAVEVIPLDENAQWSALAAGEADASLEVWPSGHADNIAAYIDQHASVENGGPLGPVGRIGWYIPSYLLAQEPSLHSWEGLQDPANAALFAGADTFPLGRFWGAAPSYAQYDEDIIRNLGLPLDVVFAGSEEALLDQLDAAYDQGDPILLYLWTPHHIHAKYDLTRVELPPYNSESYAQAADGGVDCDYPPDALIKILSPCLKDKAPKAYHLLKNMHYETEDQIAMMASIHIDGSTPAEASRAWVDANELVWQAWLP